MKSILFKRLSALCIGIACTAIAMAQQPRPEYPRPQFERAEWVNLNGTWTYAFDFGKSGDQRGYRESKGFEGRITVPFCPESPMSGVEHKDFINCMWYQRTLDIPAAWAGRRVLLHFGAIDWEAQIYVDGRLAGSHVGGSSSFDIDLTRFVEPGKQANLVVKVLDDIRSAVQTGGKQSVGYHSAGCNYTRVTGIWQTVWMEALAPQALRQVVATPDIDQQQLVVRPEFYAESMNHQLTVTVMDGKKKVAERTVNACNENVVVLPIKKPRLWSPEDPYLYDIVYTVRNADGQIVDEVKSYAGMRKVHQADGYFYLNNQPYYQRLVLDQGFYPEGVWTAPSDEALRRDIELAKAVGFNGARLHQKVFEPRYYYWADRLGYLTWGESASWGLDVNSTVAARNFIGEWTEIVERDRNHPSLVVWTPFNETWGARAGNYERLIHDVYRLTKAIDPTRPVNDASGDCHVKTDIWTVHDYSREYDKLVENHTIKAGIEPYRNITNQPWQAVYEGQPYMVDEFGGLPWIKESERGSSWGYGSNIDKIEDFYTILDRQLSALKACPHVVGFCYTQMTDVEQEKNGVYYYDRTPKFDTERIRKIFEKIPSIIENPQDLSGWKKK